MLLQIDDYQKIQDLQDRFNLCFPKLKIEFCKRKHNWAETCPENQMYSPNTPIGTIRKRHSPGVLEIKSWDKVGEAEKEFYNHFGLNVQICYRSGERWIQTGKSDNITIRDLQERAYSRPQRVLL